MKTLLLVVLQIAAVAQSSILKQGKWMKLAVRENGVYQIDYKMMSRLIQPSGIDPMTIKIYAFPTGMLPQPNGAARQKGLKEIAIQVTGSSDGRFDNGDKVIFYGEGPDAVSYDESKKTFLIENNLYDNYNYYFLTTGGTAGKRIQNQTTLTGPSTQIKSGKKYFYSETDRVNILKSGRDWFGIDFDANTEATISWDAEGIIPQSDVTIITRLMAESYQNAGFKIEFNGILAGQYPIASIPQTSYGLKGRTRNDTAVFKFNGNTTGKQTVKLTYDRGGNNYSIGRLDYLITILEQSLSFNGTPELFFNTQATPGVNELVIRSPLTATVWDVSDPFDVKEQMVSFENGNIRFKTSGNQVKSFIVFSSTKSVSVPEKTILINNQDLGSLPQTELVIITHPDFIAQARRLANHRTSNDGISAAVVTTDEIYHEYSGGRQDPTAIRDFLRDRFFSQNGKLKYALMFGKGTYDYRNITGNKTTWVPIYQSVNSLSPLETYSSDDYFAFLENNEGSWNESLSQFHTLDIGVGRIPCTTPEQAQDFVDKIISYDTSPETAGSWKRTITFVADDGDGNIHQSQANQLAGAIEQKRSDILTSRLFLDLFPQEKRSFGETSVAAADALARRFHEGSVIINFTGHGSEQLWMAERILEPERIAKLANRFRLPFLVTATCEFGRTDDPILQSAAEQILLKKASGAIGLVTSSRPVSSATNFDLNSDLYQALFTGEAGEIPTLGTMFRNTKNARDSRIGNRNFILLGDPSMKLAFPEEEVKITSITSSAGQNKIGGLETITISGEIRKNEEINNSFQGNVSLELYDRPSEVTTLGDENTPFGFDEWQQVLFRGTAEVKNGKFIYSFTTPSRGTFASGKILTHATSTNGFADAGGSVVPVQLIAVNNNLQDITPPGIQLWMNDTTFINGGTTGKDPVLRARLTDNTGIDLSQHPLRRLMINLDDSLSFFAEPYYTAQGGTGVLGTLSFQFFDLKEGAHQATVYAFDLGGNNSSQTIQFIVEGSGIQVKTINSFPNPFLGETSIYIEHSRPGDDLSGTLTITDRLGSQIRKLDFEQVLAPGKVILMRWDGTDAVGNKLPSGLYYLKAEVRSLLDGTKTGRSGKVVLLN